MLGFGLGYEESWHLMWDGRVCHRTRIASALKGDDGDHGFAEGGEAWEEEVMPFEEAPPDVRDAFRERRTEILADGQHERPALAITKPTEADGARGGPGQVGKGQASAARRAPRHRSRGGG